VINWFRGQKVALRVSKECSLSHTLGSPEIQFTIDIRNTGGRTVEFSDIDCVLKKSTGEVVNLPIKAYLQGTASLQGTANGQAANRFPITLISLRPGEQWNATVFGYNEWGETDEQTADTIVSAIREDIQSQYRATKQAEMHWFPATPDHVKGAEDFFNAHFRMTQGQYVAYVAVKHDDQILAVAGYPIVIYQYQIDHLRSLTKGYQWGSNLVRFLSMDPLRLVLNRPQSESDAARGYSTK
jgi:hypothetical protein